MKIDEMSREEIVQLTDEQIDMMVKVKCMEEGIPLAPKPPESSFFEIPKTVSGFNVKGTEIWFEKRELAESVARLLNENVSQLFKKQYQWQTGYDVEWLESYETEITIEEKLFYDKNQIEEKESMLVKRKTLKEQYDTDLKKYNSSRDRVRKISESIYSFFYEARKTQEQIIRTKNTFQEYVELSGGDQMKAKVFFDKAYKESLDEEVYKAAIPQAFAEALPEASQ